VDGEFITRPFHEALAEGLVDVPFMFGSMGYEAEYNPDVIVRNYTQRQWGQLIEEKFSAWGPHAGRDVNSHYREDALRDPQAAYDAIVSDFGITCATPVLARKAYAGRYSSPIYVFVNNWGPAKPVVDKEGRELVWAYHVWDQFVWMQDWPSGYEPMPSDLEHSEHLRTLWYDFASHGECAIDGAWSKVRSLGASAAAADACPCACTTGKIHPQLGWKPVNSVTTWPASYGTFVIMNPQEPPLYRPPSMVPDYKKDTCALYAKLGIDQSFWWCD
jgi:hypothetical protein